jgi:ATP-dependent RNA helicase RhlE
VPSDGEDYVHRIGRTARAETKGTAITLINKEDQFKFKRIEKLIGKVVDKIPIPLELGEGPSYDEQRTTTKQHKPGLENRNAKKITPPNVEPIAKKQLSIFKKNPTQ